MFPYSSILRTDPDYCAAYICLTVAPCQVGDGTPKTRVRFQR